LHEGDARTATVGVALIFCVYISIQPVQGGTRALIAEACPSNQQQEANAWVSRISGLASVLGYLSAYLDLPQYMSWFGDTQFKNLSVLASLSLALSVGLTCTYVVEERSTGYTNTISNDEEMELNLRYRVMKRISRLFQGFATLPRQIWYILIVQFFAWMGWFPYLFYLSTYVPKNSYFISTHN
jgi:solute carrier family 45 protein 1/2/4